MLNMRSTWRLPIHLFFLLPAICITTVFALENPTIGGYVQTENHVALDDLELTWNENRLNLKLSAGNFMDYGLFSEVQLRSFGFVRVDSVSMLQGLEQSGSYPGGVELREAYLDLYSFPFSSVDLRLGRQIINWGSADALNPTSNISPDNLEILLDFGEHLAVDAFQGTYYGSNLNLTCVFVPTFTPSRLPPPSYSSALLSAFSSGLSLPPGVSIEGFTQQIELPDRNLTESSQYAVKLSTFMNGFDLSFSYYYGRYHLPIPSAISMSDSVITLIYPEVQVIGGDFAGAIGSVGIWGEGAVFFPEEVLFDIPELPGEEILKDEPYARFIAGCDYTFGNGVYVNTQVLHGFLHEQGSENLNDYLTFGAEQSFLNSKLTLVPVSFAISVSDWDDPTENYGLAYVPELTYRPVDNIELTIGGAILHGEGENLFRQLNDRDELYLKARASF
jgi:hypothetical protein